MRDFVQSEKNVKRRLEDKEKSIRDNELDILRVVYYVNIQYKKFKSALRALSVLLHFDPDDELALLATVYCYYSLKRHRKAERLLAKIEPKLKTDKAKDMFDYLNALVLTEIGNRNGARQIYQRIGTNLRTDVVTQEYEQLR